MLVSQNYKTDTIVDSRTYSFPELLGKRYKIACIDIRAIFYAHASPDSELLGRDDYVDENGVVLMGKS